MYEEITKVALGTPRTLLLSNDPLQFITRSKFLGFPDITAIDIQDGNLIIYATSVFGKLDFGVNRARALKWVSIVKIHYLWIPLLIGNDMICRCLTIIYIPS